MGHKPDTDEERLRELITEAHGVIKDLRAAIRECHELKEGLRAEAMKTVSNVINAGAASIEKEMTAALMEHVQTAAKANAAAEKATQAAKNVVAHIEEILKAPDRDAIVKIIGDRIVTELHELVPDLVETYLAARAAGTKRRHGNAR